MRILQMFLQICLVASCDMAVAGSAGLNAAGIMPKVHDMWVNCRFGSYAAPISV